MTKYAILVACAVLCLSTACLAQGSMPVGSSGQLGHLSLQESATQRAAEAAGRGAREVRKAEEAKDPAEQKKHWARAQEHFLRSLKIEQNFDALLGLGRADLALGDAAGARSSCREALALKPGSGEAQACVESAEALLAVK